ncbi:MAG: glycosyltransferase family 4 protein [Candidatus Micrarchaeaceae archaeon]
MKILWLAHRDPLHPKAGGAERAIAEICSRLAEMQYDVTVLTAGWKGCENAENFRGFKIRRFGNSLSIHFYVPLFIMKNKPDIVINDLGHAIPWPSTSFLRRKKIIFFRHLHARSLPGQVNALLAYLITAVEKCYFIIYPHDTFITESTTSVSDLLHLGIDEMNIVKIPPGVDLNIFRKGEKTTYPTIVYFGGMRKYKRPEEVIHVFNDLVAQIHTLKLTIVGSGPELRSLRELVSAYNLDDRVTFTGRVTDEVLAAEVSKSWLNIHTSVTEGWGLSITEASAAGTPTVAYSVPGVVDAVEDGINGIKVKDGDRKALTDAAMKILSAPEKWWVSCAKVGEKYSWDKTARLWDETIKKVLEK